MSHAWPVLFHRNCQERRMRSPGGLVPYEYILPTRHLDWKGPEHSDVDGKQNASIQRVIYSVTVHVDSRSVLREPLQGSL
ncbi:unnamed protein product, partial [Didymodactylos carnosus]